MVEEEQRRGRGGGRRYTLGRVEGGVRGSPLSPSAAARTQVGAPVGRHLVRPLAVRAHRPSSSFLPRLLLGISRISSGATRATGLSPA